MAADKDTRGGSGQADDHDQPTHVTDRADEHEDGPSDDTDRLVEQWAAVVPLIDPKVEGVVDRLLICARYLDRLTQRVSLPHDIQLPDYEILARLFWVGPPHRLRPTQLAAGTMTAATTVTSRLDRLQKRGLIRRLPDPTDRRAMAAELTGAGHDLFARIVEKQAMAEREIFTDMSPKRLKALAGLLSEALVAFEKHEGPPPRRVRLALDGDLVPYCGKGLPAYSRFVTISDITKSW